ncbi:MAG TPA: DNA/RNA non-specific endonuclease [Polyangiales bacterium]
MESRRARTLLAEGAIRSLHLPRRKPPRALGQEPFDHSGHLIGHRFGGPNRRANIVAMHGLVNLNPGSWYVVEDEIADFIGAGTGTMRVRVRYHEAWPLRPIAFHVEARSPSGAFRTWHVRNSNPYLPNPQLQAQLEATAEKLAEDSRA